MTPAERFVHFVSVFIANTNHHEFTKQAWLREAVDLALHHLDWSGEQPMEAAWEYAYYRDTGSARPEWMPNR